MPVTVFMLTNTWLLFSSSMAILIVLFLFAGPYWRWFTCILENLLLALHWDTNSFPVIKEENKGCKTSAFRFSVIKFSDVNSRPGFYRELFLINPYTFVGRLHVLDSFM